MNHAEINEMIVADRQSIRRDVLAGVHRRRMARRNTIVIGSVMLVSGIASVGWVYPQYLQPAVGGPILSSQSLVEPYRSCMLAAGWTPMENPPVIPESAGEYGSELMYEQFGIEGNSRFTADHTACMRSIGAVGG